MRRWLLSLVALATIALGADASAQVSSPEDHFGFRMGTDRRLATAEQIESYFENIAAASDRVELLDLGPTTDGHRTVAAVVSAPENIASLQRIRDTNARLADPRQLTPDEARSLIADQKLIIAIGASIHASEIGASQAANELLHTLATTTDPSMVDVLRQVVVVLIPMLNPDGHRLVTDWYERTRGTRYEGGPMPWLYHRYAGHDINRDGFMVNLEENRNLARFMYSSWHPQVFLTMHQMEPNGPRFFVPPNTDPIDPNYDPIIWRSAALLGDAMALELQREQKSGVVSNAKYDYYWPGFEDSTPLGHNTICLLTEVASVDIATPVTIRAADLRAGFKGLTDYRPQINFPDPWPGGQWTLRDIVDYELTAVRGLLYAGAAYRRQLLTDFYEIGARAVAAGRAGDPYAFVITPEQHDPTSVAKLESLLLDGAIEIHRALEPFTVGRRSYADGTDIIFLTQPYRAFVKTLLERQRYPVRRFAAGGFERPYDVTGWSLPDLLGVNVDVIDQRFEAPPLTRLTAAGTTPARIWAERNPSFWAIEARGNAGAIAASRIVASGAPLSWATEPLDVDGTVLPRGTLIVPHSKAVEPIIAGIARDLSLQAWGRKGRPPALVQAVGRARIGLYKPWHDSIDEGWTRWVLEQHNFAYTTLTDQRARTGNLREQFDVIVLPNIAPDRLVSGWGADSVPEEFAGGLGSTGVDALRSFVAAGGRLVCLGSSAGLAINAFALPLTDVTRRDDDRLFIPGSLVRLDLDSTNPLGFGMPPDPGGMFAFSSAYEVPEGLSADVAARYATRDLLISGWVEGESFIAGRAAVVRATVEAGDVVILGFPVQHRGQSLATFRFLFNALLTAPAASPATPTRTR